MGASDLLRQVRAAGFVLDVADGMLLVTPASKLTVELRTALRDCKSELVALLIAEPANGLPRPVAEREAARILLRDGVPIPKHIAEAIAHGLLPKGWRDVH